MCMFYGLHEGICTCGLHLSLPRFQPWENRTCQWWWSRFKEPPSCTALPIAVSGCHTIMIADVFLLSSEGDAHECTISSHHASRSTLQYLPGAIHLPRPRTCTVGTESCGGSLRPGDYRRRWLRKGRLFPSHVQCHASMGRSFESKAWCTTTALRASGY